MGRGNTHRTPIAGILTAAGLVVLLLTVQLSGFGSGFIGLGRYLAWIDGLGFFFGTVAWLATWYVAIYGLLWLVRLVRRILPVGLSNREHR